MHGRLTYWMDLATEPFVKPSIQHPKTQGVLYESQVSRYDHSPLIVGIKTLPATLPIITHLIRPFWSIKSCDLSLKDLHKRTPCI